jgi:hypothetical protein
MESRLGHATGDRPARRKPAGVIRFDQDGRPLMSNVSFEEVNLMLRLYELRRDSRLRQARTWFLENFHPSSAEEMMQSFPQGSEDNTSVRMVVSYWDMVASIVNRGLINDELFFESNGEIWVVWDRIRNIVPTWRAAFKNPLLFQNLEETCERLEAWREKKAPGSSAAMREMMKQLRPKANSA